MKPAKRIVRKPEVFYLTGLSDTTVWRMERDGRFPKRIQLGANSVGWFADEIDGWMASRGAERATS